jgi:hypothetical protein
VDLDIAEHSEYPKLYPLARLDASSPISQIVISLGIAGLGTGIFISPNNSSLMGAAPHHRQGIAAGIMATARNLGMVLGVGMSGAISNTLFPPNAPTKALFPALHTSFLVANLAGVAGFVFTTIQPQKEKT